MKMANWFLNFQKNFWKRWGGEKGLFSKSMLSQEELYYVNLAKENVRLKEQLRLISLELEREFDLWVRFSALAFSPKPAILVSWLRDASAFAPWKFETFANVAELVDALGLLGRRAGKIDWRIVCYEHSKRYWWC